MMGIFLRQGLNRHIETHAVDLAARTLKRLWKNLSEANAGVRKAENAEIEVSERRGNGDCRSTTSVITTRCGDGEIRRPAGTRSKLFAEHTRSADDRAKLWLAKLEGNVVSGSLILYHGQQARVVARRVALGIPVT